MLTVKGVFFMDRRSFLASVAALPFVPLLGSAGEVGELVIDYSGENGTFVSRTVVVPSRTPGMVCDDAIRVKRGWVIGKKLKLEIYDRSCQKVRIEFFDEWKLCTVDSKNRIGYVRTPLKQATVKGYWIIDVWDMKLKRWVKHLSIHPAAALAERRAKKLGVSYAS